MTSQNKQVRLAKRPVGDIDTDTFEIAESAIPEPAEGQFTVRVEHVSLDPAMRGWLNDVPSYVPPVGIGEVMRAHGVGTVTASGNSRFPVGQQVSGSFGVTEHALSDGKGVLTVDESVAPSPTWLGALGFPGMTAYFGLLDVGRMRAGDTVVVSGAAGAVGSLVGQIAKLHGCRVIGIAGGPEKCAWLTGELGFDDAIDYRAGSVGKALRAVAPQGIDVYFDNVGGKILDSALAQLRRGARVVICGAISGYNATEPQPGPARYLSLLVNRASMAGFIVFDYTDRFPEGMAAVSEWIRRGQLTTREQVETGGVHAFTDTLAMLFDGRNTGKLVLKL